MDSDGVEELGATFALEDEDHTLANALRYFLNKNPHVSFCGYSIPHPSEPVTNLRIQTTGLITPREALEEACKNLKAVCAHMKSTFREEMKANQVPVAEEASGGGSSGSGSVEASAMEACPTK